MKRHPEYLKRYHIDLIEPDKKAPSKKSKKSSGNISVCATMMSKWLEDVKKQIYQYMPTAVDNTARIRKNLRALSPKQKVKAQPVKKVKVKKVKRELVKAKSTKKLAKRSLIKAQARSLMLTPRLPSI